VSSQSRAITGKVIARTGEFERVLLAAGWFAGTVILTEPTLVQAGVLFGVPQAALRKALGKTRAPRPKSTDLRRRLAGSLTTDQLLSLAVILDLEKSNGSAHTQS
jgi:hypothetical protein